MGYSYLKKRIKKNEGFSFLPYKDSLGYFTVGFGHLIKKNESQYFNKSFSKAFFVDLFEKDFSLALTDYKKHFANYKHNKKQKELLIEMVFQLGVKKVLMFKKMLHHLSKNDKHMVCLEMMKSLWFKQTPKRVEDLIYNFLKK